MKSLLLFLTISLTQSSPAQSEEPTESKNQKNESVLCNLENLNKTYKDDFRKTVGKKFSLPLKFEELVALEFRDFASFLIEDKHAEYRFEERNQMLERFVSLSGEKIIYCFENQVAMVDLKWTGDVPTFFDSAEKKYNWTHGKLQLNRAFNYFRMKHDDFLQIIAQISMAPEYNIHIHYYYMNYLKQELDQFKTSEANRKKPQAEKNAHATESLL